MLTVMGYGIFATHYNKKKEKQWSLPH
jgi:hypothetical protein